jgi:multiple sugar transport system ATP-binding protein
MANVRLEGVRKIYQDGGHVAVHGVDLAVADGEFVVLVGPSGCGKSTTLRMIAGLESITAGSLFIGDRLVNEVPPKDRDIAMVFQNYALYPHMNVRENLAFALQLRKLAPAEIERRVKRAAETLGLEQVLERKPRQLSGGQRQRVAVGRAIVREPAVFLFDEPLSNLDAKLRVQTRREIAKLHRDLRATMIYVTHDQVEAMTLGDRIVVMNEGRVQQVDTPLALYDRPANRFVAGFIGSPAMNFIAGEITESPPSVGERGDGDVWLVSTDGMIAVPWPAVGTRPIPGTRLLFGVRPEDVGVAPNTDSSRPSASRHHVEIDARVELAEPLGNETFVHATAGSNPITARSTSRQLPTIGSSVRLTIDPARGHWFDLETGNRATDPSWP